jgi:hypothetical protein
MTANRSEALMGFTALCALAMLLVLAWQRQAEPRAGTTPAPRKCIVCYYCYSLSRSMDGRYSLFLL